MTYLDESEIMISVYTFPKLLVEGTTYRRKSQFTIEVEVNGSECVAH